MGFPGGSEVMNLPANADVSLIPGSGRYLGEGNGNPLQYSCLEKNMDRGAWRATVHGDRKEFKQQQQYILISAFKKEHTKVLYIDQWGVGEGEWKKRIRGNN